MHQHYILKMASLENNSLCNKIFKKEDWIGRFQKLELDALIFGIGLDANNSDSDKQDGETYAVLCVAKKGSKYPVEHYPSEFPERQLFLDCLNPYTWIKDECAIHITEPNIVLNVSDYFRSNQTLSGELAPHVDGDKLKPSDEVKAYALTFNEIPQSVSAFFINGNLYIEIGIWDERAMWQFKSKTDIDY